MKAMVFAAGEGRRMRPLTLATPKPLLRVGNLSLLEHLIRKLQAAGVHELVLNVSYLADQILKSLRQMDLDDMQVHVSVEEQPLETGGGLKRALPYLGDEPFLLINSDVWSDISLSVLKKHVLAEGVLAHLVLVESPEHNHHGDFVFGDGARVRLKRDADAAQDCLTFAGVSVIDPQLISKYSDQREIFPLRDILFKAIEAGEVTGEYYPGFWSDVGTPERLESVRCHYEGLEL